MFTRAVELTSKPGKSKELAKAINERAVPILKKQQGFVDEIVLVSDAEHETLRHLLDAEPMIRTFDVHSSITHKVAADKAA